jgi:hypothetical protein
MRWSDVQLRNIVSWYIDFLRSQVERPDKCRRRSQPHLFDDIGSDLCIKTEHNHCIVPFLPAPEAHGGYVDIVRPHDGADFSDHPWPVLISQNEHMSGRSKIDLVVAQLDNARVTVEQGAGNTSFS